MVFMEDSERAAKLALYENLETGLHLNLVLPYDSPKVSEDMKRSHGSAIRFFQAGPWTQVIYNPFITRAVVSAFQSQLDEYRRLFGKDPVYFNGHKHFHLSLNMIIGNVLPPGLKVRRSFSIHKGEKSVLNRFYRSLIDAWLQKRYVTTDSFFSLSPVNDLARLRKIARLAQTTNVELMTHPWSSDQFAFLTGDNFRNIFAEVRLGGFEALKSSAMRSS